jgi:hypothetical protein
LSLLRLSFMQEKFEEKQNRKLCVLLFFSDDVEAMQRRGDVGTR